MSDYLSDFIWVNDELNNFEQIIPRRYTLIHDPNICDLFLCINQEFMYHKLISNEFRLLGEWVTYDEKNYLYYLYIDLDFTHHAANSSPVDDKLSELPRLIKAIHHGDDSFFNQHQNLLNSSIYLFIHSSDPSLDCIKYFGSFLDFK